MRRIQTLALVVLCATAAFTTPAFAQGKDDDVEFEPEGGAPPSKTLERAVKLYDKGDYFSASIELKKVINGETQDDAKNKQRAEFFLGKTVYQMGYYAGALKIFEDIVNAGPEHAYHGATLKWL